MSKIGKQDLADEVMTRTGLVRKDADSALNAVLDAISDHLKAGDKVTIPNFGTFEIQRLNERTGRNIRTGEDIKIAAHNKVKFSAGKALAEAVR